MNQKCRLLALYSIKWDFNKAEIDLKDYERLEDGGADEFVEDGLNDVGDGLKAQTACCNIF